MEFMKNMGRKRHGRESSSKQGKGSGGSGSVAQQHKVPHPLITRRSLDVLMTYKGRARVRLDRSSKTEASRASSTEATRARDSRVGQKGRWFERCPFQGNCYTCGEKGHTLKNSP